MAARFSYKAKNCVLGQRKCVKPQNGPEEIHFTCKLVGIQCEGTTKDKKRCTRQTVKALPYCWQHYQKINRVRIAKSSVPNAGFGLFVCDTTKKKGELVFKKKDLIAQYNGDVLDAAQLNLRYGEGGQTATYTWNNSDLNEYLDSACKRYLGAYANDPKGTGKRANAKIDYKLVNQRDRDHINPHRYRDLPDRISGLVAIKDIYNGDEIFVSYGAQWWNGVLGKYNVRSETINGAKTNQRCRYKR